MSEANTIDPMHRIPTCVPKPRKQRPPRRGAALLLCLFVIFMISSLVLNMLDTETLQLAATRNAADYERALYLANAAVHHACAELEADPSFRGTVDDGAYPADDTYRFTVSDGVDSSEASVMAYGVSGAVTRTVDATINL